MKKALNHRSLAIIGAATFLPAGLAVGMLSGSLFKLANPDNIDVWQPLAYLGHGIIPGAVVLALLLAVAVTGVLQLYRKEKTLKSSAKLPLLILGVNTLLLVGIFAAQNITRTAEDNWARDNGQMTHEQRDRQLDQFFKNLDDEKR